MLRGQEIKRLREAKQIGQKPFADLVGCSQQQIAAIENGKVKQSGYVFAIARALDCPLSEIETEVPPIEGLLYRAAVDLQDMDSATAERFLKNFLETIQTFNQNTRQQVEKIARFTVRPNASAKRRRPHHQT